MSLDSNGSICHRCTDDLANGLRAGKNPARGLESGTFDAPLPCDNDPEFYRWRGRSVERSGARSLDRALCATGCRRPLLEVGKRAPPRGRKGG